jgi:hypothetical protein
MRLRGRKASFEIFVETRTPANFISPDLTLQAFDKATADSGRESPVWPAFGRPRLGRGNQASPPCLLHHPRLDADGSIAG